MVGAVGTPVDIAVDLIGAECRPNMQNTSSMFRYRGVYLTYRSSRKYLMILYVGGRGEIVRYFGGGDGEGVGGSNDLFSSGGVTGDGIRTEDESDDAYKSKT